jgi:hypothetical protein
MCVRELQASSGNLLYLVEELSSRRLFGCKLSPIKDEEDKKNFEIRVFVFIFGY